MKIIKLSSGKECLVDTEDFEWLSKTKWSDDGDGYAIRYFINKCGKKTTEKMHRLIIGARNDEQVDHINGIPSDNRKMNLRIVTNQQNSRNKNKYNTNKTGYKGVAIYKKDKFTAQITHNYKKIHLGVFDNVSEAALAYNKAAKLYFGEYAKLNKVK